MSTMTLSIATDPVPLKVDADGDVRVGGTRVTLHTVVGSFNDGLAPEEIVSRYPSLTLGDVYAVVGYYLRHQAEVDAYVCQHDQEADEIRRQNEARFPPAGIRERLLARRAAMAEGKG